MPDGAFTQTEQQFIDLLDVGSAQQGLDVRLYTMAGVRRGEDTARRIAERYTPFADLFDHPPRMLIVTGANPVEPDLEDEAIWPEMVRLLTWARHAVPSMLLSCLAAHAALSVFDGLARESLPVKCTGVFPQRVDRNDPLSAGLAAATVLPHSRVSTVPTDLVRAAGYQVPLESSDEGGWSVATRQVGDSRVVLVQAHPEYGPTSLLREYQRDVRRYVRHERDGLPVLPRHCSAPEDAGRLAELQQRITSGERDPGLVESFPFADIRARAPWSWRMTAEQLYTNWLAAVPAGSR
jgi:homoserine O-succinyltransferase